MTERPENAFNTPAAREPFVERLGSRARMGRMGEELFRYMLFDVIREQQQAPNTQGNSPVNAKRAAAAVIVLSLALPAGTIAQTAPPAVDDRANAVRLFDNHDYLEVLPLLEKLHKADPKDRDIAQMLACTLAINATLEPDGSTRAAMLIRARKMLMESKAKGSLQDLSETLLAMNPPDGKTEVAGTTGRSKEVDAAMRAGEAAFGRKKFGQARKSYELAVALDPKCYEAALFLGDTYFVEKDMERACRWFAKAADIDPNRATAFRYWGDALTAQAKHDEARDKYVAGVVAEPYARPAWLSLGRWARSQRIELKHPRVLPIDFEEGKAPALRIEDGTVHLAVYDALRKAWKEKLFKETFPGAPAYRPSLAEDAQTLGLLADAISNGIDDGSISMLDPCLASLVKLMKEGLLEPYILFARANDGVAKDYPAYREKHREKLLEYLSKYVVANDGPEVDK